MGIEFFTSPSGDVLYIDAEGAPKILNEECRHIICTGLDIIAERYPEAFVALQTEYRSSARNRSYYNYLMFRRFAKCNFGALDGSPDIDQDGKTWRLEDIPCPLRGECRYEGIICRPIVDNNLTTRELEILESIVVQNMTMSEIADKLYLSVHTINKHRENIKSKTGAKNVKELAIYYIKHIQKK